MVSITSAKCDVLRKRFEQTDNFSFPSNYQILNHLMDNAIDKLEDKLKQLKKQILIDNGKLIKMINNLIDHFRQKSIKVTDLYNELRSAIDTSTWKRFYTYKITRGDKRQVKFYKKFKELLFLINDDIPREYKEVITILSKFKNTLIQNSFVHSDMVVHYAYYVFGQALTGYAGSTCVGTLELPEKNACIPCQATFAHDYHKYDCPCHFCFKYGNVQLFHKK